LRYRYLNGTLKNGGDGFLPAPLWPWPMGARIKAATTQASAAAPSLGIKIEDLDAWRIGMFGKSPDE
jgi:hypothetical protein